MPDLQNDRPSKKRDLRWLVPCLGLTVLAIAALGYRYDPGAYFHVLKAVMKDPYPSPFIDAQQIPAVVNCSKHGVDVYVSAPCDPLHRKFPYSPLWLWATFLPTDKAWTDWMGLALDVIFFVSLALLPQTRRPIDTVVIVLATFSSMPIFALERGNMDLVMFLLIICAGRCWLGSFPARFAGYGLIALAGLLKFYPLVLFLLFLRERVSSFIMLCVGSFGLLAAFAWHFQGQLREMAKNIPTFPNFNITFGYLQFPFGLSIALRWILENVGMRNAFVLSCLQSPLFRVEILCLLALLVVIVAARLVRTTDFRSAFIALAPDERGYLVIGAALIGGCFFAGQNDSYRGIHFLFALPGLLALSARAPTRAVRVLFRVTTVAVLFVMWGIAIQQIVTGLSGGSSDPIGGSVAAYVYWIIRELSWWWIVSVFVGVLACFVAESGVWRSIAAYLKDAQSGGVRRRATGLPLA
jgi:hypothetical protein